MVAQKWQIRDRIAKTKDQGTKNIKVNHLEEEMQTKLHVKVQIIWITVIRGANRFKRKVSMEVLENRKSVNWKFKNHLKLTMTRDIIPSI
jgi:hypothetical protein